ncbi:MAG: dCTP deaminase [Candidatus Omnitrophica bacterium]|nr:dCTP deaminase [Candidatus Omnitrophota bacterium]
MIKSDLWIEKMVREHNMIEPFAPEQVRDGCISYGLSSYGYDMRLSNEFMIWRGNRDSFIDPKNMSAGSFDELIADVCVIPAGSYVLGRSLEYFRMPDNIMGTCVGKSTLARCGIVVNVTPLEPGWEGHLTISIINGASSGVKLYAEEGIAQILFFQGDEICRTTYKDKRGKYDAQRGVTLAKM